MKFLLVNSDNFENAIMTQDAYVELRLQMSTGDFHTHTVARTLPSLAAHFGYWDLIDGELDFVSELMAI